MLIKNVSSKDILAYNCGFGNFVIIKAGEIEEVKDQRAAKSLLHLLAPAVEAVGVEATPEPKEEVKEEAPKEEKPKVVRKQRLSSKNIRKRVTKK